MLISTPFPAAWPIFANDSSMQTSQTDPFSLQVFPSVSSAKLTWTETQGNEVEVYRDGARIGATTSQSYTDLEASSGDHTYQIVCQEQESAAVSVSTGLSQALIHQEFKGDQRIFDGSRVVNLLEGKSSEQIASLSALTKGTLFIQFKSTQSGPYVLISDLVEGGFHQADPDGLAKDTEGRTQAFYVTKSNLFRTDYGKSFVGSNGTVSPNSWHTAVISINDSATASWRVTMDGTHLFNLDSGQIVGFFSRLDGDLKELLAGGARAQDGSVLHGLHGEIAQIALMEEYLSDSQAIELSQTPIPDDSSVPDVDPDASISLQASGFVSKAMLSWNSSQAGSAIVYRDGQIVASGLSGSSWTDTDPGDGEHTYQVVVNGAESSVQTVQVGVKSALIYKQFADEERKFDGTQPYNLLENASESLIDSLGEMTHGTLIVRFKDDGTQAPYMLMGVQTEGSRAPSSWPSTNPAGILSGFVTDTRKVRVDIHGGSARAEAGSIAASKWHTLSISNTDSTSKDQFKVYLDGSKVFSYPNSQNLKDWFQSLTGGKIREIYVGGLRAGDFGQSEQTYAGLFKGTVDYAALIDEDLTDAELIKLTAQDRSAMSTLFDGELGRTWVATGGGLGSSSMEKTGFNRTYSQIFSENISIDHTSYQTSGANYDQYYAPSRFYYPNRQRYVINTSFSGNTIQDIDENYDRLIDQLSPHAVAIMLDGNESLTPPQIQSSLRSVIDKNLGAGRATIIQIPPCKDTPLQDLGALAQTVVDSLDEDDASQVAIIDHEQLFVQGSLKSEAFDEDGTLNAKGHLLVSNQMSSALNLPSGSKTVSDTTIAARSYTRCAVLDEMPTVNVDGAAVSVSTSIQGDWNASVAWNGQSLSQPLVDGSATFDSLPEDTDFTITVSSADGTRRLKQASGTTGLSQVILAPDYESLSDLQQQLVDKVEDRSKKMKWLFMGDSITHGICTSGYDSVMQVFEHYIHEDLGRTDDIVINAGVSNGDFINLGHFFDQRYTPYKDADVVVMMLGTNDSAYSETDSRYVNYKANMEQFIETCRSNGQIVILRNPPKIVQSAHANHGDRMAALAAQLREVAAEKNCLLADHYRLFEEKMASDSTTGRAGGTWSADGIHPEAYGQLAMARQLITTMGLYDQNSTLFNTDYVFSRTWSENLQPTAPSVSADQSTIFYPVDELEEQLNTAIGEIQIELSDGVHIAAKEVIRKENASLGTIAVETAGLDQTAQMRVRAVPVNSPKAGLVVFNDTIDLSQTPSDTIVLKTKARYGSVTLSWSGAGAEPVTILRDGQTVAAQVAGSTWTDDDPIDLSTGFGSHTYQVVGASSASEEQRVDAGLKSSLLFHEFEGDQRMFDGNRVYDLLEGADASLISRLQNMSEGSIILRFKDDGSSLPYALFSDHVEGAVSTSTDGFGLANDSSNQTQHLVVTDSGALRADLGFTRASGSSIVSSRTWHTVVVSKINDLEKKDFRLTIDGRHVFYTTGRSDVHGLFNHLTGTLDEMLVGGARGANGSVLRGFHGEIAYAAISEDYLSDEQAVALTQTAQAAILSEMITQDPDNVWVMTGGAMAAGDLSTLQLNRTYASHLEEVLRWELTLENTPNRGSWPSKTRYIINTARSGQTLVDLDRDYAKRVEALSPKAVAIMLDGNDDLSEEQIRSALESILAKNIAHGWITVLQVPPVCGTSRDMTAIAESVAANHPVADKVTVINHNTLNNIDSLFTDGKLNATGHLAIGNQIAQAVCGRATTNTIWMNQPLDPLPERLDQTPRVDASGQTLLVKASVQGEWTVTVHIADRSFSKALVDGSVRFTQLPENTPYRLTVIKNDQSQRLATVYGVTGSQQISDMEEGTGLQQQIRAKLSNSSQPMKWLFMGDSITHGCMHIRGADTVSQIFERYLRDELSREEDIVINTGVSSAYIQDTVEHLDQTYLPYQDADIVIMMFGTNDSVEYDAATFKTKYAQLIDTIQANGSIVVLRTPNKVSARALAPYAAAIRELAQEKGCILADHYLTWEKGMNSDNSFFSYYSQTAPQSGVGNSLHPNHTGHLLFAQDLFQAMGMVDDKATLPFVQYTRTATTSLDPKPVEPELENDTIIYDTALLDAALSTIGEITLTVSDETETISKTMTLGEVKAADPEASSIGRIEVPTAGLSGDLTITVQARAKNAWTDLKTVYQGTIEQETPQPVELDKTQLQLVYDAARAATLDDYSSDGKSQLLLAIDQAQEVLESARLQSEINEMASLLNHRWMTIRRTPFKEALESVR